MQPIGRPLISFKSVTPAEGDRWCSRVRFSLEDRKKQGRFFRSQEAASSERENLTLEREFLKKIGISQVNLSKMESGKRPIGKTLAKRIEQAFNVDYRYFLE